jgi:4-hydroxybenzoate polyprenyltransferase
MNGPASTARAPLRALLETLRAPLLLSPVADVLAGWTVAAVASARALPGATWDLTTQLGTLALAAGAGCCLLAAGMAQNALVDLPEDRLIKPERPLPSGDIRPRTVALACMLLTLGGVFLAASISRAVLLLSGAVVLMTLAYHVGLKRQRVSGCVALGLLRGMDLMLGATAFFSVAGGAELAAPWDAPDLWHAPLLVASLYALYIMGASLHASTDDEQGSGHASRTGLLLAAIALVLAAATPAATAIADNAGHALVWGSGAAVAVYAVLRLRRAARILPPPAITGVALSGLFLFDATVCLGTARWPGAVLAAVLVLALFGLSRLALRVFPPT